jgi:hypothetical protein
MHLVTTVCVVISAGVLTFYICVVREDSQVGGENVQMSHVVEQSQQQLLQSFILVKYIP